MEPYNPHSIENKWQKKWQEDGQNTTNIHTDKQKLYVLDMFPYPSGEGLHVGHPKGYIATDIYSRMKKMAGFEVLHPMGWDAFGLPAEQFALKNKVHPRVAVEKNIARFKEQLSIIGFNYDWSKEINTTDPEFYKWTQWIFKQMWKKGLAYESHEPINWCPSCKTGLANEDLESDGTCERCGTKVEKRPLRQWVLKITDYADRMIADLDKLAWPEGVKLAQKNWIGRNYGVKYSLKVKGSKTTVETYSTHYEAFYADTFAVIAADHKLLPELVQDQPNKEEILSKAREIAELRNSAGFKADEIVEGVFTGLYLEDPITGKDFPLWVSSYALPDYGTGIIKCSAHDTRDFAFAKKYNLPLHVVLLPTDESIRAQVENHEICFSDFEHATILEPAEFKGKAPHAVRDEIAQYLEEKGYATKSVQYKLKDWVFARQRYWGEPFPMVFDENHTAYPVADSELPVKLPEVEAYEPTGTGESPLAAISDWVNVHGFVSHSGDWKTIPSFESYSFNKEEPFDINDGPGKDAYESGAPIVERNNIACIIKHPSEEKYLIARWKQVDWNGFVTGGIDQGQSEEGAARQEVKEETGFTNIKSVEVKNFSSHGLFYHVVKKENRLAHYKLVVVELAGLEREEVSEEEKAICDFEWVDKEKVETLLTRFDMKSLWQHYMEGKVAFKNPIEVIKGTRETNTMPQWAGSSWYYLRFPDPKNNNALSDPSIEKKWQPVDVYVGGDHATRHLIYARFWHKFLYDIGIVSTDEPFSRLEFLGFILAEDGRKMSKRLGNVINPDDVVKEYGADTLRMYEMFMAPFEQTVAWDTKGIIGVERFLERVWKLQDKLQEENDSDEMKVVLHKTIKKVGEDVERFKFNTAVSAMMICLNKAEEQNHVSPFWYGEFLKLLAPFAPHIAEELWSGALKESGSIHLESWPKYEEALLVESTAVIAIQINGKLRGTMEMARDTAEMGVVEGVKKTEIYKNYVGEMVPKKIIFVPNKLINIVI